VRLVLVHGIHQEGKDPDALKRAWIADLEAGIGRKGALDGVTVEMPFYGDRLVGAMARGPTGAIAQGAGGADDREMADFLAEGLAEQAADAGIRGSEIAAEQARAGAEGAPVAVEQGFPMSRRINAIVSLLEKVSPKRGDWAVMLLGQAYQYLRKPHVAAAVDDVVRPALAGGPIVLVTHSLGTVVSFKLLREIGGGDVALYATCGSPLTLSTVQRALGPPFGVPAGVKRWVNLRDPDDFISLDRGLEPPLFPGPVENRRDFENPGDDAHAIPGYLSDPGLAKAVAAALGV
jgi:hypothetical protein